MKRYVSMFAALALLAGCGGGDDTPSVTATGTWSFVDPTGNEETMVLTQSAETITGSTSLGGSATGTADGAKCDITVAYPDDYTLELDVTISGDTMSGTVTDSNGGTGNLTATRTEPEPSDGSTDNPTDGTPASGPEALIGTWRLTETSDAGIETVDLTINANGTWSTDKGESGTWTADATTITITTGSGESQAMSYSVSSNTMTTTGPDGEGSTYTRI